MKKQIYIFVIIFLSLISYLYFYKPPKDFPVGEIISIPMGETLQDIADRLYIDNVISHKFVFSSHVILLGGEKRVIAGDYLLDRREGPASLAYRFVHGQFRLEPRKITVPEGWNVFQIAETLEKNLVDFNKSEFLRKAKLEEGYLFPDTYFISPVASPEVILEMMKENFEKKVLNMEEVKKSPHTLKEILTMASIVELEASTTESRRIVSGILWKRLSLGMPLQVDAAFSYINGKGTFELSAADLKIDSPYNTYKYAGLPPTPIGNPGLVAILASVNPVQTDYLYFLSGKDGAMHYAKTLEEHAGNRIRYLGK